ncbi:MAG TPA: acetyl-CoA decarbonylase/synthase complex subunit alpha/beta [Spirochaetota bacterium]|nr:CO dehydrogenase/CO-methylating acetyl-CoA synthase complex subunit beta [Spirochaetota bacterium]HPG52567.1 acetyl-CoA decarbonylase/synthase complex subunit alpha/beta [Spirochaetota bacterium]HPN13464.1 acetyl-CoA decarbonylase/synthase complex subunit alpha/beta [Spirochaetota bacterium]
MSKIISSAAIRGAYKIVERAEADVKRAIDAYGPNREVAFPNTGYYLPIIYGIMGYKVQKLADMEHVLKTSRNLLPPPVKEHHHLPYLGPALDAGMATFFAEELIEAIRYIDTPDAYVPGEDPREDNIWLGAADDVIMRKRGVEFVDGTAPGFAAMLGAPEDPAVAAKIALELQEKNLYVFMSANTGGKTMSEQLVSQGVQIGWPTRLVPFGKDTSSVVFSIGFATRAAMSFGGIDPGDYRKILIYNKDRVFAFGITFGFVDDEWYANGAGCINYGFPIITDTPTPQILPTGICTYEHVVSNVPHESIVARAIEVRGLKVTVSKVTVPVSYGPAFEGERVRGDDIYLEAGGGRTPAVELVVSADMNSVTDGKIEVVGPELTDVGPGSQLPMAIYVEVAGRQMQPDFEPILERQIHHLINYAQGVMHIGQRDIAWLRVSKQAVDKGFRMAHLGSILHAKLHQDFGKIFDKAQVTIFTEETKVRDMLEKARALYKQRDERIAGMTDEDTDPFYSCLLCQSFAPNHVCVVTPERTGLCGAYNWLDCKASFEINPTGPNQPVHKGAVLDARYGRWKGVDEFVAKASRGTVQTVDAYSIMRNPMTSCGCFECIAAILPLCNGVMTVDRDTPAMTPSGMKFTTLAGMVGGGNITPGFVGHSKYYITSKKFLAAEGGIRRLVWMPRALKEQVREPFNRRAAEIGEPDLLDKIADETVGTTEEEVLAFLTEKGHPALTMEPLF